MESLGLILCNKFILVAVDTNLEYNDDKKAFVKNNVRKVYKLNDHLLISATGQFYKATDIYRYILKLNEFGRNQDFDEALDNLKSVFGSSPALTGESLVKIMGACDLFFKDRKKIIEMINAGKLPEGSLEFIKDLIEMNLLGSRIPPMVHLIGLDKVRMKAKLMRGSVIGHTLIEEGIENLENHQFSFILSSAVAPIYKLQNIIDPYVNQIESVLVPGWENMPEKVDAFKRKAKQKLTEAINKISPFRPKKPNVVFYELSEQTGFKFKEPGPDLKSIYFNRDGTVDIEE